MNSQRSSLYYQNIGYRKIRSAYTKRNAFALTDTKEHDQKPGSLNRGNESNANQQSSVPRSFQAEKVEKWMDEVQIVPVNDSHQIVSIEDFEQTRGQTHSLDSQGSSYEEFFEAEEEFYAPEVTESFKSFKHHPFFDCDGSVYSTYGGNEMSYEVVPQMRVPLAPNNARLDFSSIEMQRGLTNIYTATPLARVTEFNCRPNLEECSILNIWEDEFERCYFKEPEQKLTVWKRLKCLTIGANADEFDRMYPWAKYSIKVDEKYDSYQL